MAIPVTLKATLRQMRWCCAHRLRHYSIFVWFSRLPCRSVAGSSGPPSRRAPRPHSTHRLLLSAQWPIKHKRTTGTETRKHCYQSAIASSTYRGREGSCSSLLWFPCLLHGFIVICFCPFLILSWRFDVCGTTFHQLCCVDCYIQIWTDHRGYFSPAKLSEGH
ncbi:uncharacterized protein LAESUDRAFT_294586 [Laetiporus sulphureus 93-53]|uniref:Uncharacterized protein n=1 Tax=Laetiporus sulphureus 93-53 TaxID=1314785 RepID=A0A165DAJ4_9APHY|nr:uncharacterized protein LAESUDRAFT_294586 [Laetiporus sulphureus 93-53]KZT04441.1 hypothetical protein LAESUDRAFT_294586 [Laetiporus sulphureus 93-53]